MKGMSATVRDNGSVKVFVENLVIKRNGNPDDCFAKPLKVSVETHAAVKELADATNRPLGEIANTLVSWALERVKIEDA